MTTPSWKPENDLFDSKVKNLPNGDSMFRTADMKATPASNSEYPHVTANVSSNTAHYSTDRGAKGSHSDSWEFNQSGSSSSSSEKSTSADSDNGSFNLFDPSTW